ncbi:uncharacterized protein LOC111347880 [Spodoptera litura]|uniref:Uncharacterized protein LOC111347880 n=1 Tax=Spodoptera litura TaxID=69820 RepID=A0A9J7IH59_SPOLT|nr:uncharacterized protein LOC111347880 [Spodoptera litura]
MAVKLFTVFIMCVFLHIVFSFPIEDEIKSHVSVDGNSVLGQSVSAPSDNDNVELSVVDNSQSSVVQRTRRNVIGDDKCPSGQRWFLNECITEEKYQEMMGEDKR